MELRALFVVRRILSPPARGGSSARDRRVSSDARLAHDRAASAHATHYLSGPSAKSYIDEKRFADERITLESMQYESPEYPQLYPPYDPQVTILDLLFMIGSEAPKFIWR